MARLNPDNFAGFRPIEPVVPALGPLGIDPGQSGLFDEHLQRAQESVEESTPADRPPERETRPAAEEHHPGGTPPADSGQKPNEPTRPDATESDQTRAESDQSQAGEEPNVAEADEKSTEETDGQVKEVQADATQATSFENVDVGSPVEMIEEPTVDGERPVSGDNVAEVENQGQEESEGARAVNVKQAKNPLPGTEEPRSGFHKEQVRQTEQALREVQVSPEEQEPQRQQKEAEQVQAETASEKQAAAVSDLQMDSGQANEAPETEMVAQEEAAEVTENVGKTENESEDETSKTSASGGLPEDGNSLSSQPSSEGSGQRDRRRTGADRLAGSQVMEPAETVQEPSGQQSVQKVVSETAASAEERQSETAAPVEAAASGNPEGEVGASTRVSSVRPARSASAGEAQGSSGVEQADRVRFVQRVARAFEALGNRGGSVRLRLHPPELGSLRLEITVRNGVMTARAEAETSTARNMLLDNLPALRERLAEHQIKVDRFEVDVSGRSPGGLPEQPGEDRPWRDRSENTAPHGSTDEDDQTGDRRQPRAVTQTGQGDRLDVIV